MGLRKVFLLYVDASGTVEPSDKTTKHYVFAGLCIRDSSWFGLNDRLIRIKAKYQYSGIDFELHARQFARTIPEQDQIDKFADLSWADRRARVLEIRDDKIKKEASSEARSARKARYRDTDPFIHLTRLERSRLLNDAVDVIGAHDRIRLFAEAIHKDHPTVARKDPGQLVEQAFEQVVSRFDTFLRKIDDTKRQQTGPRSRVDYGLLIIDQDKSAEPIMESIFNVFRQRGHSFGPMTHVIDVPLFASSAKVAGLQFVDICAYVVRRYFDKAQRAGSHEEANFIKLLSRFDRDSFGRLHGVRHYVPHGTCDCLICQERGHSSPVSF
jgi:hypothetical protein